MQVIRLSTLKELEPWHAQWRLFARGVPFRRYEWLECWWRHYGQSNRGQPTGGQSNRDQPNRGRGADLYVLAVVGGQGELVALAPWRIDRTATRGHVIKFLGDGEVCSEYPTLLCRDGYEQAAANTLATWLTQRAICGAPGDRWDRLELAGVEADDLAVGALVTELRHQGNLARQSAGLACWRLHLPATWDDYLAQLSKSHRKQLRQLDRNYFRSGRAVMHWVHRGDQLAAAIRTLVDLHQRRWRGRGRLGCFASPQFLQFHQEVAPRLLALDALRMSWLELEGRPVAAEYHLAGAGTVYAYQCGIAPEALPHQPGRLSNLATIRRAIERGDQWFDFLRGNEPYKRHWRAVPRPTTDVVVIPSRASARIRYGVQAAGQTVVDLLKTGWHLAGDLAIG